MRFLCIYKPGKPEANRVEVDGDALDPAVAVDPSGNATAVWEQSDDTRLNIWARRFVPGAGWAAATQIDTGGSAVSAQVAVDSSGNATAVWVKLDGTRNLWASRFTPASGWGTAIVIDSESAGDTYFPRIAVGPSGNAIVVWLRSDAPAHSGSRNRVWANILQ